MPVAVDHTIIYMPWKCINKVNVGTVLLQGTFGWAWRKSTALLSRGLISCVLISRTGRRRNTGLNINSHWTVLPKTTSFKSVTSLVTFLTPWPTAPAWGSLQRTEIMTTAETPTAIAVTQVDSQCAAKYLTTTFSRGLMVFYSIYWQAVGGSITVGKHIWMEGISGWEGKRGHWGGGAFTGGLGEALPLTWRWPRWRYGQPGRLTNTEGHFLPYTLLGKQDFRLPMRWRNKHNLSRGFMCDV